MMMQEIHLILYKYKNISCRRSPLTHTHFNIEIAKYLFIKLSWGLTHTH